MSEDNPREIIIALRGGVPKCCDFCGKETQSEQLHPEEGGDWVCEACMKRWEEKYNEQ